MGAASVFGSVSSLSCNGLSIYASSTTGFREGERWEVLGLGPACSPTVEAVSYESRSKFELIENLSFSNTEIRKDVTIITLSLSGQELALSCLLIGTSLTGSRSGAFLLESEKAPAANLPLSDFGIL